jgi:hypothetical protein
MRPVDGAQALDQWRPAQHLSPLRPALHAPKSASKSRHESLEKSVRRQYAHAFPKKEASEPLMRLAPFQTRGGHSNRRPPDDSLWRPPDMSFLLAALAIALVAAVLALAREVRLRRALERLLRLILNRWRNREEARREVPPSGADVRTAGRRGDDARL